MSPIEHVKIRIHLPRCPATMAYAASHLQRYLRPCSASPDNVFQPPRVHTQHNGCVRNPNLTGRRHKTYMNMDKSGKAEKSLKQCQDEKRLSISVCHILGLVIVFLLVVGPSVRGIRAPVEPRPEGPSIQRCVRSSSNVML